MCYDFLRDSVQSHIVMILTVMISLRQFSRITVTPNSLGPSNQTGVAKTAISRIFVQISRKRYKIWPRLLLTTDKKSPIWAVEWY